jgi:hypothetical protein
MRMMISLKLAAKRDDRNYKRRPSASADMEKLLLHEIAAGIAESLAHQLGQSRSLPSPLAYLPLERRYLSHRFR